MSDSDDRDREPVAVAADIGPMPRPMPEGMFDPMPTVTVEFDNGETKDLFEFYPDEISFREDEIIGKTEEEIRALRRKKDTDYLQS
jgi:hypothetical protein